MGILIAVASKNNIEDVLNFMNNNEDCLIKENLCPQLRPTGKIKHKTLRK